MPTARESRAALTLVTGAAVGAVTRLLGSLSGSPEAQRADLLDTVPSIIAFYADGSSALAADFYDDERERASARGRFTAEPVILDRAEKIGRAIAWASQPLFEPADATVLERLAPVVQLETARPYRDTITTNRERDPEAVGWRRIAEGGCPFCRMLADRGAVYKSDTARFASHTNCHCTAQPVFRGDDVGNEASVVQYVASKRRPTDADRARVRTYLEENYGGTSSSAKTAAKKAEPPKPSGLAGMSRTQVEHQIRITEGLKASDWRTGQLERLRKRLAEF